MFLLIPSPILPIRAHICTNSMNRLLQGCFCVDFRRIPNNLSQMKQQKCEFEKCENTAHLTAPNLP